MKENSLCHRGVRATNGHFDQAAEKRNELAPFQLIELHSAPASAALHDSGLGGISQPLG
jgi:hypothetical protein